MSLSRPSLFCALAGALFASCTVSERSFSLPAETVAAQIGPSSATAKQPRIFLAAWAEESQLAEPPKAWPEWPLYARLLERVPGDVVELAWVRAGTGKMNGTARLLEPVGPHRAAREAIAVSTLGRIEEVDVGGRLIWRLNATLERRSRDRR